MKSVQLWLVAGVIFCGILISCKKSADPIIPPLTPTDLTAVVVSPTQVNLSWVDKSTNETGFKLERKTPTTQFSVIGTLGSNATSFSDVGLTPGATYTYRVYAYNDAGNSPSYSNEVTVTLIGLATLTTTDVLNITAIDASSGGTITNDGGGPVSARGVVWSTATGPTVSLSTKTSDGSGAGSFGSYISGLTANTKYYVRAYATNAAGTAYGNEISFTTNSINVKNGLIAFFPFSGNAGDSSGNNNHGKIYGGIVSTTDRFGNANKAYLFDGQTGYIDVPTLNSLAYKPLTYSTWISVNDYLPTNQSFRFKSIVGRNTDYVLNAGELGLYAGYGVDDNTFLFWRGGGYPNLPLVSHPTSRLVPALKTWIHIVFTLNSNGDWQWFLNGKLSNSGNFTDPLDYYNFFRIGGDNIITRGNTFWDGKIDDLRIYNRVLSQQEISFLFSQ